MLPFFCLFAYDEDKTGDPWILLLLSTSILLDNILNPNRCVYYSMIRLSSSF